MPGYSATPLAKKLGIKPGFQLMVVQAPLDYQSLFEELPAEVIFVDEGKSEGIDFIHLFVKSQEALLALVPRYQAYLKKDGMMWISWPKGSSSIETDLKRDFIREYVLSQGLVDTKVAAVNEDWSGLKFVYKLKDR